MRKKSFDSAQSREKVDAHTETPRAFMAIQPEYTEPTPESKRLSASKFDAATFWSPDEDIEAKGDDVLQYKHAVYATKHGEIAAHTNVGGPWSKYKKNQDGYIVSMTDSDMLRLGVFDGVGGGRDGRIATGRLIQTMEEDICEGAFNFTEILSRANRKLCAVNSQFTEQQKKFYATGVFAEINIEKHVKIWWTGDAKAMVLREKHLLESYITEEQNIARDKVVAGRIDPEAYYTDSQQNIITNSFGADTRFVSELGKKELQAQTGDFIILCSDGVSSVLSPEDIEDLSKDCETALELESAISKEAFARNNSDASGFDIITKDANGEYVNIHSQINTYKNGSQYEIGSDQGPFPGGDNFTVIVYKVK